MLEYYKNFLKSLWHHVVCTGLAYIMLALVVMMPSIVVFALTYNSEHEVLFSVIGVITSLFWGPIPLRPVFFKTYTLRECYANLISIIGVVLVLFIVGALYAIWITLPLVGGFVLCTLLEYRPGIVSFLITCLVTIAWGPGAHYLYSKLLDRLFP